MIESLSVIQETRKCCHKHTIDCFTPCVDDILLRSTRMNNNASISIIKLLESIPFKRNLISIKKIKKPIFETIESAAGSCIDWANYTTRI